MLLLDIVVTSTQEPVEKNQTQFTIEFGDLSMRTFEIVDVCQIPVSRSADFLFKRDEPINAQLNLITCAGEFDSKSRTYDDRVIVVAKFIE